MYLMLGKYLDSSNHIIERFNPPSKIRPGGTEAQQGYSIA